MRIPDLLVPAREPVAAEEATVLRRRRRTTAATLAVGTLLLAATLRVPRGSTWFTALGFLVAAAWTVGALVSGPIPIRPAGPTRWRSSVLPAAMAGVAAFLAFLVAYVVGQHLPVVSGALDTLLAKADAGPRALVLVIALVNGVAEELFFRGALHAALEPRHAALWSTIAYVAVTVATGNIALVVAAAVMGTIFSLERLSTRAVLAPMVTHLSWSTLMLLALPR